MTYSIMTPVKELLKFNLMTLKALRHDILTMQVLGDTVSDNYEAKKREYDLIIMSTRNILNIIK